MTEREWREASDMRSSALGIAAVIVSAALLRFWALGSGIPDAVAADEADVMDQVVRMMKSGDFNPHVFQYPSLYLYVQLLVASVKFVLRAASGVWRSVDAVGPADFYLWGRAASAILGTVTAWLVYQIGLRWGARHALLGAGLVAVLPLHVRESHYLAAGVLLTFCAMLSFLLALRAHEKGSAGAFAWAGVAAGLATATRYGGVLVLLMPFVAAWMTPNAKPSRLICALAASAGWAVAFLAGAPYTVLDLPAFLNGVAAAGAAAAADATAPATRLTTYVGQIARALSWPAATLALAGLILGIVRTARGPGRVRWTLLVVFPLVWLFIIARRGEVDSRQLLPILPAACVLAAIAVVSGVSLLRRFDIPRAPRTALIAALTITAILPLVYNSLSLVRSMRHPEPTRHRQPYSPTITPTTRPSPRGL